MSSIKDFTISCNTKLKKVISRSNLSSRKLDMELESQTPINNSKFLGSKNNLNYKDAHIHVSSEVKDVTKSPNLSKQVHDQTSAVEVKSYVEKSLLVEI